MVFIVDVYKACLVGLGLGFCWGILLAVSDMYACRNRFFDGKLEAVAPFRDSFGLSAHCEHYPESKIWAPNWFGGGL